MSLTHLSHNLINIYIYKLYNFLDKTKFIINIEIIFMNKINHYFLLL